MDEIVIETYVCLAGSLNGHGQAAGAGALGGDSKVGRFASDAVRQARSIGGHIAGCYGVHMESERRTCQSKEWV